MTFTTENLLSRMLTTCLGRGGLVIFSTLFPKLVFCNAAASYPNSEILLSFDSTVFIIIAGRSPFRRDGLERFNLFIIFFLVAFERLFFFADHRIFSSCTRLLSAFNVGRLNRLDLLLALKESQAPQHSGRSNHSHRGG